MRIWTAFKCEICSKSFDAWLSTKSPKRKRKCCSRACGQEYRTRQQRAHMRLLSCTHCHKEFRERARGKDSNVYCSRRCANSEYSSRLREKSCTRCGLMFKPTGSTQLVCLPCAAPTVTVCAVYFHQCRQCDKTFCSGRANKRTFCGMDCRYMASLAAQHERYMSQPPVTKTCQHCAKAFTVVIRKHKLFCSERCARRSSGREDKHRRRTLITSQPRETVRLGVVLNRDAGICQICRKPVKDVAVPHPKAPTLDHIIPLSQGGAHQYRNVRLAHFICNSRRGDNRVAQLRLM